MPHISDSNGIQKVEKRLGSFWILSFCLAHWKVRKHWQTFSPACEWICVDGPQYRLQHPLQWGNKIWDFRPESISISYLQVLMCFQQNKYLTLFLLLLIIADPHPSAYSRLCYSQPTNFLLNMLLLLCCSWYWWLFWPLQFSNYWSLKIVHIR